MKEEGRKNKVVVLVGSRKPVYYYKKTSERIKQNGLHEVVFLARGRNISNAIISAQMCCRYLDFKMGNIAVWDEVYDVGDEDNNKRTIKKTCISVTIVKNSYGGDTGDRERNTS